MTHVFTSTGLRDRFRYEYKVLLNRADTVVSAPFGFAWVGGYNAHFGGQALCQTLPLRTYVGLKRASHQGLKWHQAKTYQSAQQQFTRFNLDPLFHEEHCSSMVTYAEQHLGLPQGAGFYVYALLETDWIDTSPFYTSLGLALMLESGFISETFFTELHAVKGDILKHKKISEVYYHLWKMTILANRDTSYPNCGAETFMTLAPSQYPRYFMAEFPTRKPLFEHVGKRNYKPDITLLSDVDRSYVHAKRLEEYCRNGEDFLIDYAIISPSRSTYEPRRPKQFGQVPMMGNIAEAERVLRAEFLPDQTELWIEKKLELIHYFSSYAIAEVLSAVKAGDSMKLASALESYQQAFDTLYFHGSSTMERYPTVHRALQYFQSHTRIAQLYWHEKLAMEDPKVIVFGPRMSLARHQAELESYLKQYAPEATIDYVSWAHTDDLGGPILEQYKLHHTSEDHEALDVTTNQKVDPATSVLVVDMNAAKIYVNGRQLTSKDLKSSQFTSHFLYELFQSENVTLCTNDLEKSSYTQSRAEFCSKITTPLVRALKKYAEVDVAFDVSETSVGLVVSPSRSMPTPVFKLRRD